MVNDSIKVQEPATSTKLLQAVTNTISGSAVTAEGIYLVSSAGIALEAADNTANPSAKIPVLAGVASTFAPNWTSGNVVPLSLSPTGALRTTVASGTVTAVQGAPNAGGGQAWPVILSGGAATGVTGISAVDDITSAQTVLNSFNAGANLESLFVEPLGSQNMQFQQEVTTGELQVVLHLGTTGIDPRQIRALNATDQPDITVNQTGTLKTSNANVPLLTTNPAGRLQIDLGNLDPWVPQAINPDPWARASW